MLHYNDTPSLIYYVHPQIVNLMVVLFIIG